MTEYKRSRKNKGIENGVGELHLENGNARAGLGQEIQEEATNSNESSPRDTFMNSSSQSPSKTDLPIKSPSTGSEKHEEVVGGDVTVKLEPGQPPKLARSSSQKILSKPVPLFHHHSSKTEESKNTFQVLEQCSYTTKYIGSTEHGSMDCDCSEEWGKSTLYACSSIYIYMDAKFPIQIALPRQIRHVGLTQTASIVRRRWNVLVIVDAELNAKTKGSNNDSLQT